MTAAPAAAPLAHLLEGAGPPVVLLNGGMMTFSSWEPVAARLRQRYRLLRFDFRGQLQSPGEAPLTLAGHAADVAALLDAAEWESAHLVGTSFGAEVALEFAAAAPARVRSLTLITAMDRATAEFRRQSDVMRAILAGVAAGGDRTAFYRELIDGVYSDDYQRREADTIAARRAQIDQLPLAWFAGIDRLLVALEEFDLGSRLAAIRSPACVVIAEHDLVMARERALALAAALRAEVAVHPSSGHGLVVEDPEWLAEVCLEFLERVAPSAPDSVREGSRAPSGVAPA